MLTFHLTRPVLLTPPSMSLPCLCGMSFRGAGTLVSRHWGPSTIAAGSVRWLTTSGVSLKPTEGEMKLAALLKEKLNPTYLAVEDVSCGCGAKYTIHIDSEQFRGKRPIQQHKLVNEALGDELKSIHAVSIRIGGPDD